MNVLYFDELVYSCALLFIFSIFAEVGNENKDRLLERKSQDELASVNQETQFENADSDSEDVQSTVREQSEA